MRSWLLKIFAALSGFILTLMLIGAAIIYLRHHISFQTDFSRNEKGQWVVRIIGPYEFVSDIADYNVSYPGICYYEIDWGDASEPECHSQLIHTYAQPGVYRITARAFEPGRQGSGFIESRKGSETVTLAPSE